MIKKILIIGSGGIALRHYQLARLTYPKSNIIFLVRRGSNPKIHSEKEVFNKEEAILFKPDLVVICSPAVSHLQYSKIFLELGAHILCEKPLSDGLCEVSIEAINEIIAKTKRVYLLGYNLRFLKSLEMLKDILARRVIGKVLSVRSEVGQYLPDWRPKKAYHETVTARHVLGGGALLELSHEIDYLNWLFGRIEWTFSDVAKRSNLQIDVEDMVHVIFGSSGNGDIQGEKIVGTLLMDIARRDHVRSCTIIGELGTLVWDGVAGSLKHYSGELKKWRNIYMNPKELSESYENEWHYLKYCIDNQIAAMPGIKEGRDVLSVINAIKESSFKKTISVVRE